MATNIVYKPGDHLPAPVPASTVSGAPVRIGGLNAVTITDRAKTDVAPFNADGSVNTAYNFGGGNANGLASVWLEGVALFPTVTAAAANELDFGDPVYITAANALTTTSAGNTLFGHSVDPAPFNNGGGTFKCLVRIFN